MEMAASRFLTWAVLLAAATTLIVGCGKKDDHDFPSREEGSGQGACRTKY